MRLKPQFTYPLIGLVLGFGAPVGELLTRFLAIAAVREHPLDDLRDHAFFYSYELLGSCVVFAIAGLVAGRRADRLRRSEETYHRLAEHDPLTGLYNARAITERYRRELERAVLTRQPLSMMLIDVDHLKAINDTFGHPAGDRALIHVADALRRGKRAADVAARWGGDEFAILLEGADESAARRIAERIVTDLRTTPIRLGRGLTTVTATIGICTAAQPDASLDLFAAADRALYSGKTGGRDAIEVVSI